jgi:hypothetical protein
MALKVKIQMNSFESGIVAAKGAHVVQFFGQIAIISKTAQPYLDPNSKILIPVGARLSFHGQKIINYNGIDINK